jgi:rare lipoprotein A (peptidoglycan hydrolase)
MRKLSLFITLSLLLSACESISTSPDPSKSNRSFSNIDRVTYAKFHKKIAPHTNLSAPKRTDLTKYDLNNFYHNPQNNEAKEESAVMINNAPTSGTFKIGNPYEVQGVSYFPQNYDEFEETGQASWYGPDFHGKPTANGEIYDSSTMTAAHPTLPLPSMIRVTNLRNGKSAILRVNDRGPFAKNRVIDVSEKAAEELEFKDYGTTEVHIQLLRNDTDEMLARMNVKN